MEEVGNGVEEEVQGFKLKCGAAMVSGPCGLEGSRRAMRGAFSLTLILSLSGTWLRKEKKIRM